jgi:hypothetical protein
MKKAKKVVFITSMLSKVPYPRPLLRRKSWSQLVRNVEDDAMISLETRRKEIIIE